MKEQSHKDEMSAAIRGDFQRLRERGVSATLVPHEESAPDPGATRDEPAPEIEKPTAFGDGAATPTSAELPTGAPPEADLESASAAVTGPASDEAPPTEADEDSAPGRSGWLARLVGR